MRPTLPARVVIAEQLNSMQPDRCELAVIDDTPPQVNPFDDGDIFEEIDYIDPILLDVSTEQLNAARRVEVINVCRVIELIFGEDFYSSRRFIDVSFAVRDAAVRAYAAEIGAAMYAASRESFSELAAQLYAVRDGLSKVIVEDLS